MRSSVLATTLALVSAATAQVASYCEDSVCYKVNVPEKTASSGKGDIFFQIQGPSSKQWLSLGQGKRGMSGANIFVIYADSTGSNVTLSPRLGRGNFQPSADTAAQVSLLDGSGIADGKMTANIRCANCDSWQGGSMDFTDSQSGWIWAVKNGGALSSNSVSENINQHDGQGDFTFDLTKARGGDSLNPFVQAAATGTASGGASPTSASSSNGSGASGDESPSEESSGGESYGGGSSIGSSSGGGSAEREKRDHAVIAHGTTMGLAFALFFPIGAIIIRLFNFRGLVWVHVATQVFAYTIAVVGLGLGIYIAVTPSQYQLIGTYHPIIGILVVGLLLLQPILGLIHHYIYKRQGARTIWATAHVWFGRVVITLGIINGGLGLRLSDNTRKGEIAYGVVAGVVWLLWMSVVVDWYLRHGDGRRKNETKRRRRRGEKGSPASSEEAVRMGRI